MVHVVKADRRGLKPFDTAGATVQTSDPIVGEGDCLSAGFTEYTAASRLTWTFDYNEVFFMLRGSLEIRTDGQAPSLFEEGELGYIEKGTQTTIVVPEYAYMVHVTQPAWRGSS